MTKIVKDAAPKILAAIKASKSILLHCHPSPDPDSVGSALAMKFALEQLGKKATVIRGDSEIPQAFMHFPGADTIVPKNFFEVDLKEFDLFVILDTAAAEMISRRGKFNFPLEIHTVAIDHHSSNTKYAEINLVDTASPATAFILYQLFKEWKITLTKDIAADLFIGMYTDTGGFKYPPTDYKVLQAAAELSKIFPDFYKLIFTMENSRSKNSVYYEALALNSIKTYLNENVVIAAVSNNDLKMKSIPASMASESNVDNLIKSVIGWNVGVQATEVEPNKVKISFRTRDAEKFDVSKLAVALGGGGHKAAAGAVLTMPLPEAIEKIVQTAKEVYNL
jgi:phosphoesterase RecJ-like protein